MGGKARQVADVHVWFIPVTSPYNDKTPTAHSFTLYLNLSFKSEVNLTTTKTNDKGGKVNEKIYEKEERVKQVVKYLYSGSV